MIFRIFRKELLETLRDKRTVLMMIVIPTLVFPVIMNVYVGISKKFSDEAADKTLHVGFYSEEKNNATLEILIQSDFKKFKLELAPYSTESQLIDSVKNGAIDLALIVPKQTENTTQKNPDYSFKVLYNGTELGTQERAEKWMNDLKSQLLKKRLAQLNLDEQILEPLSISYLNLASEKKWWVNLQVEYYHISSLYLVSWDVCIQLLTYLQVKKNEKQWKPC